MMQMVASMTMTCIPNLHRVMNSLALGMDRVQAPEELELISSKKSNWAGSGSHVVSPTGRNISVNRKMEIIGGRLFPVQNA
ncbi:hypothetical protein BDV36DRAFT_242891 [Aspergillus pseudocaelatus]|uniref:Uncharacterized protein n=1 Tax=Aspergillus pseudocaelatus TaxID=1825620 RepID=A0ABQ6X3Z4_9EURO|nr:hypothetical protein BDV36DRAFT_242891 [Aspergillus pseudocaelatus]